MPNLSGKGCICLIVILTMIHDRAAAQQAELIEWRDFDVGKLLQRVSVTTKENYERIGSWKGAFEFNDSVHESAVFEPRKGDPVSREILKETSGRIEFLCDFESGNTNAKFSADGPTKFFDAASRKLLTSEDGVPEYGTFQSNSITTADGFIVYRPLDKAVVESFGESGEKVRRSVSTATKSAASDAERYANAFAFSPIRLFGETELIWKEFQMYHDLWKSRTPESRFPNSFSAQESTGRNGKVYRFSATFTGSTDFTREVVCTWVFAEADGFNPSSMLKVSRSTEDGRPFESIGWKYLSSNGIYVPSYYKRTVFDRQTLGVLSSRTLTLEDSEVGADVSAEHFSVNALKMQEGDRLVDAMSGDELELKNGVFSPVPVVAEAQSKSRSKLPWLISLGSLLVACVLYVMYRRRIGPST